MGRQFRNAKDEERIDIFYQNLVNYNPTRPPNGRRAARPMERVPLPSQIALLPCTSHLKDSLKAHPPIGRETLGHWSSESLQMILGRGTEQKLEFSGANAKGVYTQCEKKRKSMMKILKINNPSGGGMNETPATHTERAGRQPRNSSQPGGATVYRLLHSSINCQVANLTLSSTFCYVSIELPL
ncbi:hypothetical protein TNCV_3981841 [Trichonephila clavipes]|nr:hypothetical protein TNCV_3981841 [Trichonephila clavipes]